MKREWTLRQLLAVLRGIALIVALGLSLILLQLVPSLIHGGVSGVRDHISRVAVAGVPPDHWGLAVTRMYEALAAMIAFVCILFAAQRYLANKLAATRGRPAEPATQSRAGS